MSEDDRIIRALTNLMCKRRGREIYDYERTAARERIRRVKPWAKGRIGAVERAGSVTRFRRSGKPMSTGQLARYVYEPIIKDKDAPFRLKSWQMDRVRKAAPTFADCVGRSQTGSGRPFLWRIRWGDLSFHDVRLAKRAKSDKNRRRGQRERTNRRRNGRIRDSGCRRSSGDHPRQNVRPAAPCGVCVPHATCRRRPCALGRRAAGRAG